MNYVAKTMVAVVAAMVTTGCQSEASKLAAVDAATIAEAQEAVAAKLIDPSSPLFTEVTARGSEVCGNINGKNRYGAYVGPTRFVWVRGGTARRRKRRVFLGKTGRARTGL